MSVKAGGKRILAALIAAVLLLGALTAYASSYQFSGGLNVILNDMELVKDSVKDKDVKLKKADFTAACGLSDFTDIVILELPEESCGKLTLSKKDVVAFQSIPKKNVGKLRFVPNKGFTGTAFILFKAKDKSGAYTDTFKITFVVSEKANKAPQVADMAMTTVKNLSVGGSLVATDPDGDAYYISITKAPSKGHLTFDTVNNRYVYAPSEDKTGNDSFSYTATDIFGNTSKKGKVKITIEDTETGLHYEDLVGTSIHLPAIKLAELGVIRGETIGGKDFFYPDKEVTRGEFLVMLMKAADLELDVSASAAVTIADDGDIPGWMRSYVSAAFSSGIISGVDPEGPTVFSHKSSISRGEAAVMVVNATGIAAKADYEPDFVDVDSIPGWAFDSVRALDEAGIMTGYDDGTIRTSSYLTRGEAVELIWEVMGMKPVEEKGGLMATIASFFGRK